jgi:hypothetical protein
METVNPIPAGIGTVEDDEGGNAGSEGAGGIGRGRRGTLELSNVSLD